MLHHGLQGDTSQTSSGLGGNQRGSLSQAQKNSSSNSKNYYNNWN